MLDAHLVLNGLSRIAAQFYAATKRESDEVYALSDYLARGLRANSAATLVAPREAELLEAYLELLRACKFAQLRATVEVTDAGQTAIWPAHATCTVSRQVLHTLRLEGDESLDMHVRLDDGMIEWSFPGSRALTANANTAAQLRKELLEALGNDRAVADCQCQPAGSAQGAMRIVLQLRWPG